MKGRFWSEEEMQFLKDNYKTMSAAEISKKLIGRNKNAVTIKISNIKKQIKKCDKTDEQKLSFVAKDLNEYDRRLDAEFWDGIVTTRKELGL